MTMTAYLAVKYLHVTCVAISGSGFLIRGLLMLRDSPLLQRRWMKILPHLNDTVLLVAALTLTLLTRQYPFVDAWVTAKVFGLIVYIILGSLALKGFATKPLRLASWLAALAVFGYVISVALSRSPWGLLAQLG